MLFIVKAKPPFKELNVWHKTIFVGIVGILHLTEFKTRFVTFSLFSVLSFYCTCRDSHFYNIAALAVSLMLAVKATQKETVEKRHLGLVND